MTNFLKTMIYLHVVQKLSILIKQQVIYVTRFPSSIFALNIVTSVSSPRLIDLIPLAVPLSTVILIDSGDQFSAVKYLLQDDLLI